MFFVPVYVILQQIAVDTLAIKRPVAGNIRYGFKQAKRTGGNVAVPRPAPRAALPSGGGFVPPRVS